MRAAATFAVLLLMGCQPPTPEEVAAQTASDVSELFNGAVETARSTNYWTSIDSTYAMGTRVGTVTTRPTIPADTGTDALVRTLRFYSERIFTEKNVVPGSGGNVFALRGEVLCLNPDAPTLPVDAVCVRRVDDAQLRLKATPGIDLTLQVGPDRLEPFVLRLRSGKSIAIETDLAQSTKASTWLVAAFGGTTTAWRYEASGRYETKLEKNGTSDYTLSVSALDDLSFAITDERGVRRAFTTEKSSPMISLRLEGVARRGTLSLAIGRSQYDGAGSDVWNAADVGPLHGELAGLTGVLTLEDGKAPQLKGYGLGNATSFISYAGQTVLSVDLNESAGRKYDLTLRNSAAGTTGIDVTPSLELTTAFYFSALPYESSRVDPAYRNARYTFAWKSNGSSVSSEWIRPDATFRGGMKLVAGALSLQSNLPSDLQRRFAEGTCIATRSTPATTAHPVLDMFEAIPCP